jgi:hypothetical protein
MTVTKAIVLLAALIVVCLAALAAPLAIEGTWLGKTEVPDRGPDELTLVLTKTETGYAGKFTDSLGVMPPENEISAVKLEGDDLTFNFSIGDGTVLAARFKVEGEKMTGVWVHPEGESATMTLERKK